MKINEFSVATMRELWDARFRPQRTEETVAHSSVPKAETQKQPTATQKKIKSASVENGVHIQDANGKIWKTEDWDGSVKANAIAVITPQHKFRIALHNAPLTMPIHSNDYCNWEEIFVCVKNSSLAKIYYNGVCNTHQILKLQPSTNYAAGWCDAYTFPDGTTKGYLPALGELTLVSQNKTAINAALAKCGGVVLSSGYYWSSTFYGMRDAHISYWVHDLCCFGGDIDTVGDKLLVRAFAPFEV